MTIKDAYPLPLISNMLDTLQGNVFMSSLDLAAGYWQIDIAPEDREKTAFITKYGLFEHVRMSMGLCNAPSTFQRAMNLVLRGLTWKSVLAFLDDVLVLGKNFDDHLNNLREVLERFRHNNLKLKPKKCSLFQTEIKFLGRKVSGDSVSVDPASIECVRDWPTPECTRDVERFLGFVNYNREHIPNLAEMADPLYGLTGKNKFKWEERHTEAFEQVKQALLAPVKLSLPTRDDTFVLDVDASGTSIGAQLSQRRDGVEVPISYGSKALTPLQRRYCATRKELLALIAFIRQFRHYLLGRPFIARTDHSSLIWLTNFKNPSGQLARWLEELQQFNVHIEHRKGRLHVNADSISRIPDSLPYCECYKATTDLSYLPCGGCAYCQRAQKNWSDFEENVDDVVPLSLPVVRQVAADCNYANVLTQEMRAKKQNEDRDIILCKSWLENEPTKEEVMAESQFLKTLWSLKSQLRVNEGVLWYDWVTDDTTRPLYVVPVKLQEFIMRLGHDNTLSGHFGMRRTYERIHRHFFWPDMMRAIENYVRGCYACNRSKHLRKKHRAPLSELTMGAPMEKVHIDILGPLPTSSKNNKFVLVMICQYTKWLELAPLPDQQSETIARAMVDYLFSRLGCPRIIQTKGLTYVAD